MSMSGRPTQSLVDGLPPAIAKRIHPDWQKNEIEYWIQRDQLLIQYEHKWIGFAAGQVVASGTSPVEVLHAAHATGKHPFITCVGHENEPNRMRRASFSYDSTYQTEPLPVLTVEFRRQAGNPGLVFNHVIPDTGADASVIPWADCELLALDPSEGTPGLMGGVGESSIPTIIFQTWGHLDTKTYPCRLQADFTGHERIIGRDVLNGLEILFRGVAQEVVVNS